MNKYALLMSLLLLSILGSCATLDNRDSPNVRVVGIEPLQSEGLELRFALKLRVLNPNEVALAYDGMSVKLDLDGRGLASGVSDVTGEIPRFGEALLTVPVSMSAFSALRQLMARASDSQSDGTSKRQPIVYSLEGKLGAAGGMAATRFEDKGELDLFSDDSEQAVEDDGTEG